VYYIQWCPVLRRKIQLIASVHKSSVMASTMVQTCSLNLDPSAVSWTMAPFSISLPTVRKPNNTQLDLRFSDLAIQMSNLVRRQSQSNDDDSGSDESKAAVEYLFLLASLALVGALLLCRYRQRLRGRGRHQQAPASIPLPGIRSSTYSQSSSRVYIVEPPMVHYRNYRRGRGVHGQDVDTSGRRGGEAATRGGEQLPAYDNKAPPQYFEAMGIHVLPSSPAESSHAVHFREGELGETGVSSPQSLSHGENDGASDHDDRPS